MQLQKVIIIGLSQHSFAQDSAPYAGDMACKGFPCEAEVMMVPGSGSMPKLRTANGIVDSLLVKTRTPAKAYRRIGSEIKTVYSIGGRGQFYPYTYGGITTALEDAQAHFDVMVKSLLDDHVGEVSRDDRHETAGVQLEVTKREYQPTSFHQPETAQTTAA